MTRLFEVTRTGLVERSRTARTGFHPLRESVSWFVIRPDGPAWDITQEVFVPLTFLAGIYGMNFSYMPGLEWRYGYFAAVGVMLLITAFSLRYFARHGWFE